MKHFLQQDPSLSAKDRLIFPLDYPTLREAEKAVSVLKDNVGWFKVGLGLFVSSGPSIFKTITQGSDCGLFLDLKFHDIPETVRAAVRAAAVQGAGFVTVHACEGPRLLKVVVDGTRRDTKVLAVTVLTSVDQQDLVDSGIDADLDIVQLSLQRARLAMDAGCAGVVCSGVEVRHIKRRIGKDFIAVVPGIRPEWSTIVGDDQRRMATPREAIRDGADYIVVGRPIRMAKNPARAADRVVEEIQAALDSLRKQH